MGGDKPLPYIAKWHRISGSFIQAAPLAWKAAGLIIKKPCHFGVVSYMERATRLPETWHQYFRLLTIQRPVCPAGQLSQAKFRKDRRFLRWTCEPQCHNVSIYFFTIIPTAKSKGESMRSALIRKTLITILTNERPNSWDGYEKAPKLELL